MQSSYKLNRSHVQGMYQFTTDNDIKYLLYFKQVDSNVENIASSKLISNTLEFGFSPTSKKRTKKDPKIEQTIIGAIDAFFNKSNEGILVYICDTDDKKQKFRQKLFIKWFDTYNKGQYVREYFEYEDKNDQPQIISIIFKSAHPNRINIITEFYNNVSSTDSLDK